MLEISHFGISISSSKSISFEFRNIILGWPLGSTIIVLGALGSSRDTIVDTVGHAAKIGRVSIDEVPTEKLEESKTGLCKNEVSTTEVLTNVVKIGLLTRIFTIEVHTTRKLKIIEADEVEVVGVYNSIDEGGCCLVQEVVATSVIDALSCVETRGDWSYDVTDSVFAITLVEAFSKLDVAILYGEWGSEAITSATIWTESSSSSSCLASLVVPSSTPSTSIVSN